MSGGTDWASAVAILVSGLIFGSMFVYYFARRREAAPAADLELRDLEGKRDALVRQLRELDEALTDERTRLEVETAQVLRAIDERKRLKAAVSEPPPAVSRRRPEVVGFLWGAGSMLALMLLGYFVMQAMEPRPESASVSPQPQAGPQSGDPVARMEQAVKSNPEDLNLRMQLAQAYLERENLMGVFEQTQYVLSKVPNDARAITYQALVRMSMGQTAAATKMLEEATRFDPNLLDAWVALAWVHTQSGKTSEAEAAMQEAMRRHPEERGRLEQVLAQMKAQPTDTGAIRVRLEIEPSAAARADGEIVFLIARAEGVTSGPPVAVKRIPATALPVTVEMSAADSMMGQPLPPRVRLEARLDADGDAATKRAGELTAMQDSVAKGAAVRLSLK